MHNNKIHAFSIILVYPHIHFFSPIYMDSSVERFIECTFVFKLPGCCHQRSRGVEATGCIQIPERDDNDRHR